MAKVRSLTALGALSSGDGCQMYRMERFQEGTRLTRGLHGLLRVTLNHLWNEASGWNNSRIPP